MAAYFERARHFNIETLNILEGSSRPQASPQDRLYNNAVPGAIHDSNERCDAPKCHPETRTAVQEDVMGWIRDGDRDEEPMKIMWITGPAGSGKTAIVGSVAETCDGEGLLAATFFFSSFSGSEGRRLKGGLVTTLVYQLTQLDGMESFERDVLSTIQRNPAIFDARLQKQVEILILKPLRNRQTSGALPVSAQVIIIDGLDEVEAHTSRQLAKEDARLRNEADQVEILCALHHAARDPAFPFRILIASRPERVIRDFFAGGAGGAGCRKISLQEQYNAEADIRLFLDAKFAEIRRRYHLSLSWPDESILSRLVATASGQFIYAATVIRFLQEGKGPDPQARLLEMLTWESSDEGVHGLAPLDALYTRILQSSPDPRLATQWLRVIDGDLSRGMALFVKQVLQDFEGQAEYLLENLASLIDIPPKNVEGERSYNFYHKSLQDFLQSPWSERLCPKDNHLLLNRRLTHIFRTLSPVGPLSESEWRVFMNEFSSFLDDKSYLGEYFGESEDQCALPVCDAAWWTRTLTDKEVARGDLFHVAHLKCGRQGARNCTQACKRWRGDILRTCKSLGRRVPDIFDLLVIHMANDDDVDYWHEPGQGSDFLDNCFVRPAGFDPPAPPPRSAARSGSDLQVQDEHYNSLCEAIDDLYSRLPDGWEDGYRDEDGFLGFEAARPKVEEVMGRLGIHAEDFEYQAEASGDANGSRHGGGGRIWLRTR